MRADGTLRPTRPPRGLILSTGEDTPPGSSLRARLLALSTSKGTVNVERLTQCQKDAAAGLYTQAMAGFLNWLAPRYEEEREVLKQTVRKFRAKAVSSSMHRRTPEIVANLMAGMRLFLTFAVEVGVLPVGEARELFDRGWQALGEAGGEQAQQQRASDPASRFVQLLSAAIASGQAHVAKTKGNEPDHPEAWGWRMHTVGTGENMRTEWRPQGPCVGHINEAFGELLMLPDPSYGVAKRLGQEGREGINVTPQTLWKRLHEAGYLESVDKKRETLTIRRKVAGRREKVLHIRLRLFMDGEPDISDIADNEAPDSGGETTAGASN
jgi:hypothetical protein